MDGLGFLTAPQDPGIITSMCVLSCAASLMLSLLVLIFRYLQVVRTYTRSSIRGAGVLLLRSKWEDRGCQELDFDLHHHLRGHDIHLCVWRCHQATPGLPAWATRCLFLIALSFLPSLRCVMPPPSGKKFGCFLYSRYLTPQRYQGIMIPRAINQSQRLLQKTRTTKI